jgi:hypothetical protein
LQYMFHLNSMRCDQGNFMAAVIVQSADESQYGTSGGMAPFEKDGRRPD